MTMIRPPGCCITGGCDQGCGYSELCFGFYCCPPNWLQSWSIREQIGNKQLYLGDLQLTSAANQGGFSGQVMAMNGPSPGYGQNPY